MKRIVQRVLVSTLLSTSAGFFICRAADAPDTGTFLDRPHAAEFHLRVLNWNVWLSSIFPGGQRHESFDRILSAVKPDIICLQEIDPRRAGELPVMLDQLLPLTNDMHWQGHFATNGDNVVLSRFPLRRCDHEAVTPRPKTFQIADFHMGHVMCLVDLPDSLNLPDIYIISAHMKSRTDEASLRARQAHADSIVRLFRQLRDARSSNPLPARTPILLMGDFNVYESDPADIVQHLNTLLIGNVLDEKTFGPDITPDWDGTHLLDVKPRHNGRDKDWYTWRSDADRFAAGALDRILYTDSVLKIRNSFVLNTTSMTDEELHRTGLLAIDVLKGGQPGEFDHLPMIADFSFSTQ